MLGLLNFALSLLKSAAYEGYPGNLLDRGKTEAQAIAGGGGVFDLVGPGNTPIIQCEGVSTLVVQADMTGAANADLAVAVTPYEADGATISGVPVPVVQSQGPTLAAGHVYFYGQYDVTGVDAVRVRLTNANVGAQTITRASWRLS